METDRAVSEVVGFILIFAIIVISFSIYQGIAVPQQNRQVEFDHNQAVQGQLQDLRNAILTESSIGTGQAVSIKLGASYPDRTIANNLGVSAGSIQTVAVGRTSAIRVGNATATGVYGETVDYWNGSSHRFATKAIVYRPTYSFYDQAPDTYYANSLLYNRFGNDENLTLTGQTIIDGQRIRLIALAGNLSASGEDTVTVSPEAVSASDSRIGIRNDSHPITITIPTRLRAAKWAEILSDETVSNGGHVKQVTQAGPASVTVSLEAQVTYELRLAKVGIGTGADAESAQYITVTDAPSGTVANGSTHSIVVEARDKFNNPVAGFQVNASINGDGSFATGKQTRSINTSASGEARFEYTAPMSGSADIELSIYDGRRPYERVWTNLSVAADSSGNDTAGETTAINPSGSQGSLMFVNASMVDKNDGLADLYLNNTGSAPISITEVRFQFYSYGQGPNSGPPGSLTFDGGGNPVDYLDPFTDVTGVSVGPGVHAVSIQFFEDPGGTGGGYQIRAGEFAILSLRTADGQTITYFIGFSA